MIHYVRDYIASGEVFADESVFCIRCGTQIMDLGYMEMPSVHDPQKKVNVAYRKKLSNYRLLPVALYRKGSRTVTHLPCCQDCVKEIDPGNDTGAIIRQIKRAMQIEARYIGMPDEALQSIEKAWEEAKILRKLNPQEMIEGKLLQED